MWSVARNTKTLGANDLFFEQQKHEVKQKRLLISILNLLLVRDLSAGFVLVGDLHTGQFLLGDLNTGVFV